VLSILVDTNFVVYAEPTSSSGVTVFAKDCLAVASLASSLRCPIFIHPASKDEILNDPDHARREFRATLLNRYSVLETPPDVVEIERKLGPPSKPSQAIDNKILACLYHNAVSHIVTSDGGIHAKARQLRLSERVLHPATAVSYLKSLAGDRFRPPGPAKLLKAHAISVNDPIFDSLRKDYDGFDSWWKKCCTEQRDCHVIEQEDGRLGGLVVFNAEPVEGGSVLGKGMKFCTFKVSENARGQRFGELLLWSGFEFARKLHATHVWLTAFDHHPELLSLIESFGFRHVGKKGNSQEGIFVKELVPSEPATNLSPLEYHVRYGPRALPHVEVPFFLVPIRPNWDKDLFLQAAGERNLFSTSRPCAHAMRKAYLCNSPIRALAPGDVVLFYRTAPSSGVVGVGVVERSFRSGEPDDIVPAVLDRTVYSLVEIKDMCEKSEVHVTLFRHAFRLQVPIRLKTLVANKVVKAAPQSITEVRNGGLRWIRQEISRLIAE